MIGTCETLVVSSDASAGRFVFNELDDVIALEVGGERVPVNPSDWGWFNESANTDIVEQRRSLAAMIAGPGFSILESPAPMFVPGPRPSRSQKWQQWKDGAAPAAAVESKGGSGEGTLAYHNRLSEAIGNVVVRLPVRPERGPMVIWDFVRGRRFDVTYSPPAPTLAGRGTVYLLDDGFGIKIGYTSGSVAKRIGELQTGNPRRILTLAEIANVDVNVEVHLQEVASAWNVGGEWYDQQQLVLAAVGAGGFGHWLRSVMPAGEWTIRVHPPYR